MELTLETWLIILIGVIIANIIIFAVRNHLTGYKRRQEFYKLWSRWYKDKKTDLDFEDWVKQACK